MSHDKDQVEVDIVLMGRDFTVACAPAERDTMLDAVKVLEDKMREIAAKTRANGERLTVMPALNLALELVHTRRTSGVDLSGTKRRIQAMQAKVDDALAQQEQLF